MTSSRSLTCKLKFAVAGVTAFAVTSLGLAGASAVQAPEGSSASHSTAAATTITPDKGAPGTIRSTVRGTYGIHGTVRGTFSPDRFYVSNSVVYATGALHSVLRNGNGQILGHDNKRINIPVKQSTAPAAAKRCDILDLVLGPLNLNLLGLHVHLNKVILHIVAVSGAGQLLGNLLCAIAHLLDGTGLLNQLKLDNSLNRALTILRV